MAYYKITESKKGELVAKIQVSGKDVLTGKNKIYVKRVYNEENLTEAKFKKKVEKISFEFSEEVERQYNEKNLHNPLKELTFNDLAVEWVANIKNNLSVSYYLRAKEATTKFNKYLEEIRLADKPISKITVRDVQLFLNHYANQKVQSTGLVTLAQELPKQVNFRLLARNNIIQRANSYGMRRNGANIAKATAIKICEQYNLSLDDYFEDVAQEEKVYSLETLKGYRRVLRTLFNEAVRYEWITKNPVCATKIGAGSNNTALREVPEKEVLSLKEARDFLKSLDEMADEKVYKKIPIKFMLLTGVRQSEICGLRWTDINFEKKVVHIRRNRLASKEFGIYEKEPKTKTSKRDIPLPDSLVNDLKEYYLWFSEAISDFEEQLDDYYIASNIYREPIYPNTLSHWLSDFESEKGFKRVSCHGLRHTYCSLLLSQNVPIQTVSKYMGHSDSTITLKVYSHFIPDTQDKALNALSNITG